MSEQFPTQKPVDDEIDLSLLFKGIKNFFKNILKGIINIFSFFYNHKFVLIGLIVLGAVLGYFYEKSTEKIYTNDLLVTPNFGSADYLYTKVEALDKKLSANDSLFLKDIFGKQYDQIRSIEIKPVVDIYNFVSRNETNQDLFKLLFEEDGNIEFIENPINSRNFNFHRIYLEIKGSDNHKELSDALMSYINNNVYFDDLKKLSLENYKLQLLENKNIVSQIDSIIANTQKEKNLTLGSNQLSFSDNSGLNDLLQKKKGLIEEKRVLQTAMVNKDKTIKVVDANYKILDTESLTKKNKIKLFPLLLVVTYCLIFLLRFISKKANAIIS